MNQFSPKGHDIILKFLIIFSVFMLPGCSRLEFIDQKIGEIFFSSSSSPEFIQEEKIDSKSLSKEQKDKINIWLEENKKNRYGDPPATYYTGGTPLIDEDGNQIERYEYILSNHSEIFNQ